MSWRRITLRDVVFITVPVMTLVLYCYGAAVVSTFRAREYADWWSLGISPSSSVRGQLRGVRRSLEALALERRLDPERPDGSAVRLDLQRPDWDVLDTDPQSAFGRDIGADIIEGSALHPVKLRPRGDQSVHWLTEKKSFTVRTSKDQLWRGHRRLGFTSKWVLPQYVAAWVAEEFELFAPLAGIATVYLNDKYYGMYRVVEIPDESFLRRRSRMPGNIFRGDTGTRGELFHHVATALYRNPYIWDQTATVGPEASTGTVLGDLVQDVQETTLEGRRRLLRRFDPDELARWLALMLVTGDFNHTSDLHNNFWYQDPSDGTLHPIPWDVSVNVAAANRRSMNELWQALSRQPEITAAALRYAHEQLRGGLQERIEGCAIRAEARHWQGLRYDHLRRGAVARVGTAKEIVDIFRTNLLMLRRWIADSGFAFGSGPAEDGWWVLDFASEGYTGCILRGIIVEASLQRGTSLVLRADRNRNGRLDADDPELPAAFSGDAGAARLSLSTPIALLAGWDPGNALPVPAPLHYRFFLQCEPQPLGPVRLRPLLENRLTGEAEEARALAGGASIFEGPAYHPWDGSDPVPRTVHFRGDVELDETLVLDAGDSLVIEPGTTLRLGPDVSILSRGRIEARGTSEQPIAIMPADPRRPFGSLALIGSGADRSAFSHCEIAGGGGGTVGGIEFKGMVSVHRASAITFEACTFANNVRCDDLLNAVHADVSLLGCTFHGANADAVDFDISSGSIRDCRFEGAANDAIDLMHSAPLIVDNTIEKSGDKGISIGESSHPLIFNNDIRHCERGIEVKDASEPRLIHNTIERNRIGILQGAKNWRYGEGGFAKVVRCVVKGNDVDLENDSTSRIVIAGSVIGDQPERRTEAADLLGRCFLGARGLRAPSSPAGRVPSWSAAPGAVLVESTEFRADFRDLTDGWRAAGSTLQLAKKGRELELVLSRGQALITRDVDWDLRDGSIRHVALFEIALEGCEDAEIVVEGAGTRIPVAVPGPDDAGDRPLPFQVLAVELPPDQYSAIHITARTAERRARVLLHSCRLYALPE